MVMSRAPLTPDRITQAAIRVADDSGLAKLSMRSVGRELGVEAMSLYHHVDGKQALLDAVADAVMGEIALPSPDQPWRASMVLRATSARAVLASHPWALGLVESRPQPGPALLTHHEAVLASLRSNGFSPRLAAHAFSAIDSYVYGFVLTEVSLPFDAGGADEFAGSIADALPRDRYPYMRENLEVLLVGGDYSYGDEFHYGLDLILDGLERRLRMP